MKLITGRGRRHVDIIYRIRVIWYRDPINWGYRPRRYPGGISFKFGRNDLHVKWVLS